MKRTKLKNRILPAYTFGEDLFNCISHITGGAFGVLALTLCVIRAALRDDAWAIVSVCIYGVCMIALYTMSSLYHGLHEGTAKRVFQVLDHCTIYYMIAGTYTPILLVSIRTVSSVWAWTLFGVVWGLCAFATVFTAIDLKKYAALSMICYIGMGWCIVAAAKTAIEAVSLTGMIWLLAGGVSYTIGAILYGLGRKHKYMHSVFHIFVVLGSILQFVCIYEFVI
ncbi:MAG: hemolysin III family protein [Clostridia bacterium]|nr:hemolysin III family protein [Clostridia bacterium]